MTIFTVLNHDDEKLIVHADALRGDVIVVNRHDTGVRKQYKLHISELRSTIGFDEICLGMEWAITVNAGLDDLLLALAAYAMVHHYRVLSNVSNNERSLLEACIKAACVTLIHEDSDTWRIAYTWPYENLPVEVCLPEYFAIATFESHFAQQIINHEPHQMVVTNVSVGCLANCLTTTLPAHNGGFRRALDHALQYITLDMDIRAAITREMVYASVREAVYEQAMKVSE